NEPTNAPSDGIVGSRAPSRRSRNCQRTKRMARFQMVAAITIGVAAMTVGGGMGAAPALTNAWMVATSPTPATAARQASVMRAGRESEKRVGAPVTVRGARTVPQARLRAKARHGAAPDPNRLTSEPASGNVRRMPPLDVPWRFAIVVGASSGIGAAVARQLAAGGTRLALVARRAAELEAVAEAIRESTGDPARALVFPHDVTKGDEVAALLQRICHALGGLDLLVYAAGIMPRIGADEYDLEKDRAIVDVNVVGA